MIGLLVQEGVKNHDVEEKDFSILMSECSSERPMQGVEEDSCSSSHSVRQLVPVHTAT